MITHCRIYRSHVGWYPRACTLFEIENELLSASFLHWNYGLGMNECWLLLYQIRVYFEACFIYIMKIKVDVSLLFVYEYIFSENRVKACCLTLRYFSIVSNICIKVPCCNHVAICYSARPLLAMMNNLKRFRKVTRACGYDRLQCSVIEAFRFFSIMHVTPDNVCNIHLHWLLKVVLTLISELH